MNTLNVEKNKWIVKSELRDELDARSLEDKLSRIGTILIVGSLVIYLVGLLTSFIIYTY